MDVASALEYAKPWLKDCNGLLGRGGGSDESSEESFPDSDSSSAEASGNQMQQDSHQQVPRAKCRLGSSRLLWKFRRAVRTVINSRRATQTDTGVTLNMVVARAKTRFKTRHVDLSDEKEAEFISTVLRALPLMLKSTAWLREVRQVLTSDRARANPMIAFNKISEVVHNTKVISSRFCWAQHVEPLRKQHQVLEELHNRLKRQFQELRSDYLEEITALRDRARDREDPEKGVENPTDILYFYDPTTSLSEAEMGFVTKVVSEKLKMILERSPHMNAGLNTGQLNAMVTKVENNKVQMLQRMVQRAEQENQALKKKIEELQATQPCVEGIVASAKAKEADNRIAILEETCDSLRLQLVGQQKSGQMLKSLQEEVDELRCVYEEESTERLRLQTQMSQLEEQVRVAETAKHAAEVRLAEVTGKLALVKDDVEAFSDQVSRQQKALKVANRAITRSKSRHLTRLSTKHSTARISATALESEDDDAKATIASEPEHEHEPAEELQKVLDSPELVVSGKGPPSWPGLERTSGERNRIDNGDTDDLFGEDRADDAELLGLMAAAERRSTKLIRQRSALLGENKALSSRCRELQDELDSRQQRQVEQRVRAMVEETEHLREISGIVGMLEDSDMGTRAGVGALAPPSQEAAVGDTSSSLARREEQVGRLRESVAQLARELDTLNADGAAAEDPSRARRAAELQHVARQQEFEIFLAEVSLEAARWGEAAKETMCADLREKSTHSLLQKVVGHCKRLTDKLTRSATLTRQLTEAVNELQTQSSVTVAAFKKSSALSTDPTLQAEVERLAQVGSYDIMEEAHKVITHDHKSDVPFSQLEHNAGSDRKLGKFKRHSVESLKVVLPMVKFADHIHLGQKPSERNMALFGTQLEGTTSNETAKSQLREIMFQATAHGARAKTSPSPHQPLAAASGSRAGAMMATCSSAQPEDSSLSTRGRSTPSPRSDARLEAAAAGSRARASPKPRSEPHRARILPVSSIQLEAAVVASRAATPSVLPTGATPRAPAPPTPLGDTPPPSSHADRHSPALGDDLDGLVSLDDVNCKHGQHCTSLSPKVGATLESAGSEAIGRRQTGNAQAAQAALVQRATPTPRSATPMLAPTLPAVGSLRVPEDAPGPQAPALARGARNRGGVAQPVARRVISQGEARAVSTKAHVVSPRSGPQTPVASQPGKACPAWCSRAQSPSGEGNTEEVPALEQIGKRLQGIRGSRAPA